MVKLLLTAIIFFVTFAAVAANGQSDGAYVAPELNKPMPGRLLDQDYLTSTGETVPRPGVPQSQGETPFDRHIEQENNRIDNSIPSVKATKWPVLVKWSPSQTTSNPIASHQPIHAGRHRGGIAAVSSPSTAAAP